jgi:murein DD-endopeptidase MepM/ murein hydrolase activator NlpD
LKEQLASDEANQASIEQRKKEVQSKIKAAENEISALEKNIEQYENEIVDLLNEIDKLESDISAREVEIDSLLSFLQVANGDNVYLEYIFGAKSLTDFIYRGTVVEELTAYNDELIDEMYVMIEKDKKMQIELKEKISIEEKSIAELDNKLKSYDVSLSDLENAHSDVAADIQARKKTIEYYEKIYKENNCKEDIDLVECITSTPNTTGFVRPLEKGTISSEWGYRRCPIHGRELHSGIDIALSMNSPVYAAASGTLVGITRRSSCGGNIVTIRHSIKGKIYRTRYMHLASINVTMGQKVTVLTEIGKSGGGGYTLRRNGGWDRCSTGAHLHFMILPGSSGSSTINPRKMINFPAKGKKYTQRW